MTRFCLLGLTLVYSVALTRAQPSLMAKLYESDLENVKERKIFKAPESSEDYYSQLEFKPGHNQSLYEFLQYRNVQMTSYPKSATGSEKKRIYDSLISKGFDRILKEIEVTKSVYWCTEVISVDSGKTWRRMYCAEGDSIEMFESTIRLTFYHELNKKKVRKFEIDFHGWIKKNGGPSFVNTLNSRSERWGLGRVLYYPDVEIYYLILPYHFFDYRCDVTSPDMYFYFAE